uniref:neural cell adhesion molecule 1-like isoform X2 n=1 Tax=Solea senegalensis TaxID=28829 RepID=UPI001CD833C8|nr:neural cell adhesion molecule 1-like isoform X2 [Solea senegalensis]XP_043888004.1 neural cell adhesion molecule 1-like isoform X2 [Solea senegalensis]
MAVNQKGKSPPATMSFRTSTEPAVVPDLGEETALSMSVVLWAGILVVVFMLLLLAVDVTCYFVNKCGLIMCLCGKTGTGTKGHDLEEGKAAFVKDESKEPIVEVRTEDECTANHNAAGPTEPNETTPLTEPELAAYTAALALETLSSVATNSDTATATIDPAQDSPSSETTTLTCSLSTPANDPSPSPVQAPAPTPESNAILPAPVPLSSSAVEAKMAPLVEQRGRNTPEEEEERIPAPPPPLSSSSASSTPEQPRPQKSGTPIPPKRRHSPKLMALNAKNSPPVSPLAASSPHALDAKKSEVSKTHTETPALTASTTENTARPKSDTDSHTTAPDACGRSLTHSPDTDQTLNHIPAAKEAVAVNAEESAPLVAEVPPPDPVSLQNHLGTAAQSDMYDLLTPDAAPRSAEFDLELMNAGERAPPIPADLISLESPPSAPSLPNGDGADPVLDATKTKTTPPPVNDEYGSL